MEQLVWLVTFYSTVPVEDEILQLITCQYYVRSEDSIELIQKAVLWIGIVLMSILIHPTFHFDEKQDSDPAQVLNIFETASLERQFTLVYLSRQRQRCQNFHCLSVIKYILVLHLVEMDLDPDPKPPK